MKLRAKTANVLGQRSQRGLKNGLALMQMTRNDVKETKELRERGEIQQEYFAFLFQMKQSGNHLPVSTSNIEIPPKSEFKS